MGEKASSVAGHPHRRTLLLAVGLIFSIAVSATLCTLLFPSQYAELASDGGDLDSPLRGEALALELASDSSSSKGGARAQRQRAASAEGTQTRAMRLAEGHALRREREDEARGRVRLSRKRLSAEALPEQRALRLAEGRLDRHERKAIAENHAVRAVEEEDGNRGQEGQQHESLAVRLAEGRLTPSEKLAVAGGKASSGMITETQEVRGRGHRESEAVRLAEGRLSRSERVARAGGEPAARFVAGQRGAHQSEAERLASGQLSDAERRAIAGGRAAPKYVRLKGDDEAVRLASGKMSEAERRRIAGGSAAPTYLLSSSEGKDSKAVRLAEGRMSHAEKIALAGGRAAPKFVVGGEEGEAVKLAEGHLSHSEEVARAGGRAAPKAIELRGDGRQESEAVRLAEGKLTAREERTRAGGRAAPDSVGEPASRGEHDAEALRMASGGSGGGSSGSSGMIGAGAAAATSGEALMLAEGKQPAGADATALATAVPRRHVKLSDLSEEERSNRVQRLLNRATSIARETFKARPQELAEEPSKAEAGGGSSVAGRANPLKERKVEAMVQRVDKERSGEIQSADAMSPEVQEKALGGGKGARSGLDAIAKGAQASLSDVRAPVGEIRRGWGGL